MINALENNCGILHWFVSFYTCLKLEAYEVYMQIYAKWDANSYCEHYPPTPQKKNCTIEYACAAYGTALFK